MRALAWVFIGVVLGHVYAHFEVATACIRLGGFYVGKAVFECRQKP